MKVLATLNEFQGRLFVAEKALEFGRGGISYASRPTGMSRPTIARGMTELEGRRARVAQPGEGRIRRPGGGRKRLDDADPALQRELKRIVEETTVGGTSLAPGEGKPTMRCLGGRMPAAPAWALATG